MSTFQRNKALSLDSPKSFWQYCLLRSRLPLTRRHFPQCPANTMRKCVLFVHCFSTVSNNASQGRERRPSCFTIDVQLYIFIKISLFLWMSISVKKWKEKSNHFQEAELKVKSQLDGTLTVGGQIERRQAYFQATAEAAGSGGCRPLAPDEAAVAAAAGGGWTGVAALQASELECGNWHLAVSWWTRRSQRGDQFKPFASCLLHNFCQDETLRV